MQPQRPGAVLTVGFAVAAVGLATTIPLPLYIEYANAGRYGAGALALAFACYALTVIIASPFLGPLPDRIGRKACMLIGLVMAALSTLTLMVMPSIPALAFSRALQGIAMGAVAGAATAWATELGGNDEAAARRGGTVVAAGTAGSFGVGGVATLLAVIVWPELRPPPTFSFHLVGALVLAGLVLRLPETLIAPRTGWLRLPVFPRGTLLTTLAIVPAWGTTGTVLTSIPAVLATQGYPRAGMAAACIMMLIGAIAQQALRRLEPRQSVRVGLVLLMVGGSCALYGAAMNVLWPVAAGTLLLGCAVYSYIYLGGLSAVAMAAGTERPRAVAGYFVIAHAGFSFVPMASGRAVDAFGAAPALLGFAACVVLASATIFVALSQKHQ